MKSPAKPRRKAAPRQVRLDLRRTPTPPSPDDEIESRQRGNFWKWFGLVALFHLLLFVFLVWYYRPSATPPPPEFISLVPAGETVKGTPGTQAAPKVGPSTPAPAHPHSHPKPPTPPQPVTPPPPAPAATEPTPTPIHPKIVQADAPNPVEKPKPVKPPKPKIKVDLHLADGPTPTVEKPAKPRHKKTPPPAAEHNDSPDRDSASPDNMGLSKEQIAAKLGAKLDAAGVSNATKTGTSGASDSQANPFADFYASIHDQFMSKWQDPNVEWPDAVNPVVQIHVEKDGRVPVDQITLLRSSGNQIIDDSAMAAARSLGYLLQPLPDGCPPDISITLKITH
jgi:outer membrane biosynthesis protein TonB